MFFQVVLQTCVEDGLLTSYIPIGGTAIGLLRYGGNFGVGSAGEIFQEVDDDIDYIVAVSNGTTNPPQHTLF